MRKKHSKRVLIDVELGLQPLRFKTILRKNEYSNQKQAKELTMYRKHHCYAGDQIFRVLAMAHPSSGGIYSEPFRSKFSTRLVNAKVKLKCRTNKRTKSKQETRTGKNCDGYLAKKSVMMTTDQTKNNRSEN